MPMVIELVTIPASYTKHGYDYTLVEREDSVAIYEQARQGRVHAYEVVKIRLNKVRQAFGKTLPASERLPTDDDWGQFGKTYSTWGGSPSMRLEARRAAIAQMGVWVAEARQIPFKMTGA